MKKEKERKIRNEAHQLRIIKYFSFHDKYDKRDDTVVVAREVHPRLNISLKFIIILRGGEKEEGKKEWKEKKSGEETGSSSSIRPRRSIRKEKKRRKRANYRRKTNICRKSCGRSRYSIEFFSFPKILNMTIARWKP